MNVLVVAFPARCGMIAGVACLLSLQGLGAAAPATPRPVPLVFPARKHAPRRVEVRIADLKFKPATIEIGPGDTVVWTNDDDTEHGVKADDGSFNSGHLASGRSFEHKFEKQGTFVYRDEHHPRMVGTVKVVDK